MKMTALLVIFTIMYSDFICADEKKNNVVVSGFYISQDGRVNNRKFQIDIKLSNDGTFSGEMDDWMSIYLTDGKERVSYFKQKLTGKWTLEKESIKLVESNGFLPKDSELKSSSGLKVMVAK